MNTQDSNFAYLIRLIIQKKKVLIIVTSLAAVASIVISLLLSDYYKSTCTFYALSPKSYDPRMIGHPDDYQLYGDGSDADRITSVGNSSEISGYIINKYDLRRRYDIDTTSKFAAIKTVKQFHENVSVTENDKGAIEVRVYDENPDTAAIIANDIVAKIDEITIRPVIEANQQQLEAFRDLLKNKYASQDSLSRALQKQGASADIDQLISLEKHNTLHSLKETENYLTLLNKNIKTIVIIEPAFPLIKKAKPTRSVIVVLSTAGTFIFMVALLAFIDYTKRVLNAK